MASGSRRQRRERRFRRYLSAGRLVRAQALLQRHPGLDVDAGQPPPLHRACARHDAPALCLLLRLGADPAHQDRHGDTALHAAARQGPDGESACWGARSWLGTGRCTPLRARARTVGLPAGEQGHERAPN